MNHIYRSIWNESTGTVTAVSEHAKSRGKNNSSGKNAVVSSGFILKSVSVAVALALGSNSHASPTGGAVVAGNASITSTPGNTTINQTTQNTVLNWQSFDIGVTESVSFVQPNSNAVALNRVLGADPSSILGSLSSNGKVFLINPNGILFGTNAQVNVGGLVASTRNIADGDFMAGRYAFSGDSSGGVVNQGAINADGGYVALLGANVSNQGVIAARMGSVALAAGNALTLDVAGDGLLNVAVDAGAVNALAGNGGVIQADGGQILMTAGSASSLLQSAVNNTGLIQAQTIENRNGTIKLLGDMQSGTVNVAGTLDASAPNGGDGGFIDTSAALVNVASGTKVTTAAAQGLTGSWLIDPTDYTIAASGGNITGAQLSSDLASTNVTIQSSSGSSGSAGDVNVNDVVNWSANKLTLNAQNNINIKANLNASATASLALEFGQGAVAANNTSNIVTSGGAVNLPASTTNFTTRQGSNGTVKNYTVITSLGAQGSTTTTDLQGMNGNLALNYALGADIDASTTSGWNAGAGFMPIGGTSCWPCASLTGTIDGLGHTVSGLTVNRPSRSMIGVFGYGTATAVIRNIGLSGGSFSGASYTGTLIGRNGGTVSNSFSTASVTGTGYVGGLVGRNYGTVSDSYATGNVVGSRVGGLVGRNDNSTTISNSHAAGSVTGSQYAGGLVGDSDNTTISNSYATGSVTGGDRHAGGLVGRMSSGSISNSYATGNVSGVGWTGGLVGDGDSVTISNSHATGNVTSTDQRTGGLIGHAYGITLSNSYATGSVIGTSRAGGLFGYMYGGSATNTYALGAVSGTTSIGGLVGYMNYGSVTRSYSVGAVSGSSALGGLVGGSASSNVSNSYWNTDTSSQVSSSGGTGRTSLQMQTASNFSGFNFTTTPGATGNAWVMVDVDGSLNNAGGAAGATRPMLASEYSTTITNAHQLQLMSMNASATYLLGVNLAAAATSTASDVWSGSTFIPVNNFSGTLDGMGRTISGLTINQPARSLVGLFGSIDAGGAVRNLGVEDSAVTGGFATGGIAGGNSGVVSNSYFTGTVSSGSQRSGGLVGANYGTISNSHAGATVAGSHAAGGLVGANFTSVSNSYATGNVSGNSAEVGGLVGVNLGSVSNAYAVGSVSGSAANSGGLVGANYGPVSNSYATGAVTSSGSNAGGLIGRNDGSGAISSSFWNITTSGLASSAGGTGLTSNAMQSMSSFSGWDIADAGGSNAIWRIYEGNTNPLLRTFLTNLTLVDISTTYDGTTHSGASTVVNGVLGAAASGQNAGLYSGFYSNQQGYDITGGNLLINRANLTLSGTHTYDGSTAFAGSGLTGTGVAGEAFAITGVGDTSNLASRNVQTGSSLSSVTGLAVGASTNGGIASNYTLSTAGSSVSITQAALTLAADNVIKTYDGNLTAAASATIVSGMLFGADSISGGTFAFTDKNAGSGNKTVTATGITVTDGNSGGNYNVSYVNNTTSTIDRAVLTATVTADDKVYDGNATATATVGAFSGLIGSETLSASNSATFNSRDVASANLVTVNSISLVDGSNGGLASNYTLASGQTAVAHITPKALTATVVAPDKVYDGNTTAIATLNALSGLIGSETLATSNTATFNSKDVAAANLVTVNSIALSDGTHGGLASNYSLASGQTAIAHITPRTLTVVDQVASDKVYDGTTTATLHGGSLAGVIAGETVSLGEAGNFSTADAGNGIAVTAADSLSGSAAANYTLAQPVGLAANITAAIQPDVPPVVVTPPPVDVVPSPVDAAPPQLAVTSTVAYTSAVGHVVSNSQIAPPPTSVAPPLVAPSNGSPAAGPMMTFDLTGLNLTVISRDAGLPAVQSQDASEDKK